MIRIKEDIDVKNINIEDIQHDIEYYENLIQVKSERENSLISVEEYKKLGIDTSKEEIQSMKESSRQMYLDLLESIRASKECVEKIIINQDREQEIYLELERLNIKLLSTHFRKLRFFLSSYL